MTGYKFGEVVLVTFPFTDQSGSKKRPATVISTDRDQRERPDLIPLPITSQNPDTLRFGDVPVSDTQGAGLLMPSVIKPVPVTIETRPVIRALGRLDEDDQRALRNAIAQIIG